MRKEYHLFLDERTSNIHLSQTQKKERELKAPFQRNAHIQDVLAEDPYVREGVRKPARLNQSLRLHSDFVNVGFLLECTQERIVSQCVSLQ